MYAGHWETLPQKKKKKKIHLDGKILRDNTEVCLSGLHMYAHTYAQAPTYTHEDLQKL